jgi:hypothetical protein
LLRIDFFGGSKCRRVAGAKRIASGKRGRQLLLQPVFEAETVLHVAPSIVGGNSVRIGLLSISELL